MPLIESHQHFMIRHGVRTCFAMVNSGHHERRADTYRPDWRRIGHPDAGAAAAAVIWLRATIQ